MPQHKPQSRLMVLMFTDLVGSVDLKRRMGDSAAAALIRKHDELFRYTVGAFPMAEVLKDLGDGFLARFASASDAVHAALHFQHALHSEPWDGPTLKARVGLHLGEVSELDVEEGTGQPKLSGLAIDIAARVMNLALPGQILMTRAAFDNARQYVREHQSTDGAAPAVTRKWIAHGRYLFKGAEEALEIFEVGEVGVGAFAVPPDSEKARRAVAADQEETLGWRPAVGLEIPDRKNWVLERKLGEGGFGEVWLGEHAKSHTRRVFKFCFDAERLRSFKREITLFRLLRDALGDRNDIARLHEVQVEHPPFYLESEFTEDGSLVEWSQQQGGIDKVPLATRLDLVARTAIAVSAAHSVGVLHKDIKPSNVLVYRGDDGAPLPRLTDFGIGELTDPSQLAKRNITMVGLTETASPATSATHGGTRIYVPPEVLIGKPFTIQGDVYALGILLYQMVVGDLDRPLAQGWERDVPDPLLREDIAKCVEGHEADRLSSAKQLAERLQNLPSRRRARQRRQIARVSIAASIVLVVLLSLTLVQLGLLAAEHRRTIAERDKQMAMKELLWDVIMSVDPREGGDGIQAKVVDIVDDVAAEVGKAFVGKPEIEADMRFTLGRAYIALSRYDDAEAQLQQALDLQRALPGDQEVAIAETMLRLGAAKYWNDDFEAAEPLFRTALNMRLGKHGQKHLEVARAMSFLGMCLSKTGQFETAEKMLTEALALRRELATGEDRKDVAASLNNLGSCLREQGRFDEAEIKFREAVDAIRALRGPEHQDVGIGLSNLGSNLMALGKYDEAEQNLKDGLVIVQRATGDDGIWVGTSLHRLADLNRKRHRYVEAETYGKQALERRRGLRKGHSMINETLDLLANIYLEQDRHAEAEPLLREAYTARWESLPPNDPKMILSAIRLGSCLGRLPERHGEADELYAWSLQRLTAAPEADKPGPSGPIAIEAADLLLRILEGAGRTVEAAELRRAFPALAASQARVGS